MDAAVIAAGGSILVAAISGIALILSRRPDATATATATLVQGQGAAISRLEGQVAARDSTIEDLRSTIEDLRKSCERCEEKHRQLEVTVDRQSAALVAAHKRIDQLRARITEIGDERLP